MHLFYHFALISPIVVPRISKWKGCIAHLSNPKLEENIETKNSTTKSTISAPVIQFRHSLMGHPHLKSLDTSTYQLDLPDGLRRLTPTELKYRYDDTGDNKDLIEEVDKFRFIIKEPTNKFGGFNGSIKAKQLISSQYQLSTEDEQNTPNFYLDSSISHLIENIDPSNIIEEKNSDGNDVLIYKVNMDFDEFKQSIGTDPDSISNIGGKVNKIKESQDNILEFSPSKMIDAEEQISYDHINQSNFMSKINNDHDLINSKNSNTPIGTIIHSLLMTSISEIKGDFIGILFILSVSTIGLSIFDKIIWLLNIIYSLLKSITCRNRYISRLIQNRRILLTCVSIYIFITKVVIPYRKKRQYNWIGYSNE